MVDNLKVLVNKITTGEIHAELESHFAVDPSVRSTTGSVFFPRERYSVKDLIVSLLPRIEKDIQLDEEDGFDSLEDAVFYEYGLDEILGWFVDEGPGWLVRCWVESSMVSGEWGIMRFALGGRGYLYHQPDERESLGILSSWEPVENEEAFRACFIETYLRLWPDECLPPNIAEFAEGPSGLMEEAIWRVVQQRPEAWSYITDTHLHRALNSTSDLSVLSDRIVTETTLSRSTVDHLLDQLKSSAEALEKLAQQKDQIQLGRDLVTVFWSLVPPRQKKLVEATTAPTSASGLDSDIATEVRRIFGGQLKSGKSLSRGVP